MACERAEMCALLYQDSERLSFRIGQMRSFSAQNAEREVHVLHCPIRAQSHPARPRVAQTRQSKRSVVPLLCA